MATTPKKNAYSEDISKAATGTNIISTPCMVYHITVALEADGDAVVSFADGLTYTSTNRVLKVVTTAENHTINLCFDDGKYFATGLSAISNVDGVDVSVTYE